MKPLRLSFLTTLVALCGATAQAHAAPGDPADSRYVQRIGDRYVDFAGSSANLESLAHGLRQGSAVTLTEGPSSISFTPPTRPMGYGNVTRALDLASRQLGAAGITSPTPEQVRAAMVGGTIGTPSGELTLQGVLQLRSQGMGWGQIAHAIGVHPGMRASSIGTTHARPASAITTAAGGSVTGLSAKPKGVAASAAGRAHAGIVSGTGGAISAGASNGQGHGNAFGRGGKP